MLEQILKQLEKGIINWYGAQILIEDLYKNNGVLGSVSESCIHKYKDSSHYVIESEETYKCELSGEDITETYGYTQYEDTCVKCGYVNSR